MTPEEMVAFYNGYPWKKDAMAILIRKTGMSEDAVKSILLANGVSKLNMPRNSKPRLTPEQKKQHRNARMRAKRAAQREAKNAAAQKEQEARKRAEEAEKAVNERVFRFIFGGILPGVEPLLKEDGNG